MKIIQSKDAGFIADNDTDYSNELNDWMNKQSTSSEEPTILYFSPGKYRFDGDIVAKDNISLFKGTGDGLVIFYSRKEKATILGASGDMKIENHFRLKGIVFDNIVVKFTGGDKKGIRIRCCAFINSKTPTEIEPNLSKDNAQINVQNGAFDIWNNVFMRGRNFPGIGINTYKNNQTKIKGNFLGSFKDVKKATPYLTQETLDLLKSMEDKKEDLKLSDDEGNFVSSWYATDALTDSDFKNNFICGNTQQLLYNPVTKTDEIKRDHIIYIKQYNNVTITQNYFSGWPRDAFGQIKVRNAEKLLFLANYLDNTSFNARAYDKNQNLFLKNTYVFNNFIQEGEINYYQNFTDTDEKKIEIKDFLVFGNRFQSSDKSKVRIKGSYRNQSKEFFYTSTENIYIDDQQPVKADYFTDISAENLKGKIPSDILSLLNTTWITPSKE